MEEDLGVGVAVGVKGLGFRVWGSCCAGSGVGFGDRAAWAACSQLSVQRSLRSRVFGV